jgi:poly-gamma-glutamate capsule biosynthesis protein CapA/YwtB (metallophosphatase superfamily)
MGQLLSILLLSLLSLLSSGNGVQLTFVGDAMQHSPQNQAALQSDGSYDYTPCFQYLEQDIASADYAVVNLECPLAGRPYSGYPAFSAPADYAKQLKKSGFDLFLTANNHCLDRRDRGLVSTVNALDALEIPHIGTYADASAREAQVPFITDIKGVKFAFLNYTYGTNGIPVQGKVVVNYIDRQTISNDIDLARSEDAKVICVCLHWGIEYKLKPVERQTSLADFLVDKGVDLIIGSHPHVVEPMEIRHSAKYDKDVLIVYSLGNFISNQSGQDSRGGAMVKVGVTMIGDKPVISDARYKLFFCQKPSRHGENYVLIPEDRPELLRSDSKDAFTTFMTRVHSLVTSNNVGVPQEK